MSASTMDDTCPIAHCAASCAGAVADCGGIPAVIGAEALQLAGVPAAVGAVLGVALMATLGQTPEMLVVRDDLPRPEPIPLTVRHRPGLAGEIPRRAAAALRRLLATAVTTPNLAKGA